MALLTLATIGFCISCLAGRNKSKYVDRNRTSRWTGAGMRRRRSTADRYDEKRVSDETDGYYTSRRADSQRRLNPDVQLNAVPPPATGYDTGVSGYDARR